MKFTTVQLQLHVFYCSLFYGSGWQSQQRLWSLWVTGFSAGLWISVWAGCGQLACPRAVHALIHGPAPVIHKSTACNQFVNARDTIVPGDNQAIVLCFSCRAARQPLLGKSVPLRRKLTSNQPAVCQIAGSPSSSAVRIGSLLTGF